MSAKKELIYQKEKKREKKSTRTMLTWDPILRYLISENNQVIYRENEKGNDMIFRDYRQSNYLLHMNNNKKDTLQYTKARNMPLT